MIWNRQKGKNYDAISSGDYHIHRSLEMYTAYRVNPFKRFGVFKTAEEAKTVCEGDKAICEAKK